MKREYVVPDLLASMTADALYAGKPDLKAAAPASHEQRSICSLGRWFNAEPARSAAPVKSPAPNSGLDNDWVGGWYARTRLLHAATLANARARNKAASTAVAGGGIKLPADVVTQIKDYS